MLHHGVCKNVSECHDGNKNHLVSFSLRSFIKWLSVFLMSSNELSTENLNSVGPRRASWPSNRHQISAGAVRQMSKHWHMMPFQVSVIYSFIFYGFSNTGRIKFVMWPTKRRRHGVGDNVKLERTTIQLSGIFQLTLNILHWCILTHYVNDCKQEWGASKCCHHLNSKHHSTLLNLKFKM